jgi:hypothetical protein
MTDKKFVQSIIPSATCRTLDNTDLPIGPMYDKGNPLYVVYAVDAQDRQYLVGYSVISIKDAWFTVAETFRHKMLSRLESQWILKKK